MPFVQIPPTDNIYISQFFPNKNFGKLTTLLTGKYLKSNDAYRSLLKFDLSNVIPSESIILYAALKLFVYRKDKTDSQFSPQIINVYANTNNFSQNEITWNNAPELDQTQYSIKIEDKDINNFINIDITSIVISWFYNIIPNNGITLVSMHNIINSIIGYRSTEWSISDQRPFLNVQYEYTKNDLCANPIEVINSTDPPEHANLMETSSNAYAYIYNIAAETVPTDSDVIFDNNGVMTGDISHTTNTASIFIPKPGDYKIEFLTTATTNSQFAIVIDDTTIVSGSAYGVALLSTLGFAHQSQGQVIIAVPNGGLTITLRNVSGSTITLNVNNGGTSIDCNASIMITRLS
ncbi:DNRLRE domain-containing protein [Clostridium sp. JS66]|uniref:DNRLRE domain-containing protein n=1 Tax=Clostridium sp. JS66 TaxID=3064705 RepID=UPI00298E93CC|nr:DNRLRE domain-containing protein [Clostridium sp. JS66]WPC42495.1 DNRLRE domain-containing protein [Clostridium sp. JS66]